MNPRISRAASVLRTDHFKTLPRDRTDKLLLNYTGHVPDARIDAAYVDRTDAVKGYFGIAHHYVIKTNGDIERGRNPLTRSTGNRQRRFQKHAVFIGVVGGLDEETGYRKDTITPEQDASLDWLMQAISDSLGVTLEVSDFLETWADSRTSRSKASRDQDTITRLYAEMTDEELKASPDRITV